MQEPALPRDEAARIDRLRSLKILDTAIERRYDRFTRSSTKIFGAPIAVISLVDHYRQWFISAQGIDDRETPRDISFCGHAILEDGVFEVPNALRDSRFHDNPLVVNEPHIRFYAGAPLTTPDGFKLGTLCVIDREPRRLSNEEKALLKSLADAVVAEMVDRVDSATGLATRDALVDVGSQRFSELNGDQALSLHLFKVDAGSGDQDGNDSYLPAREIFAKLLLSFYPSASCIACLGNDEFCVLIDECETFDEHRAISHLCTVARNALSPYSNDNAVSAFVGMLHVNRERHQSFDDVMRDVDAMFVRRQLQRDRQKPSAHPFRDMLDKLRNAFH